MTGSETVSTILTGIGATMVTDLWTVARKRAFAVPLPNFTLLGRWIAHMPSGQLVHDSIAAATPVRGEAIVGWSAHYLTGISFAFLLPAIGGSEWTHHPTPGLAFLVGICTVVAPFLVMQPAMGAGVAASRTPRPVAARIHSLVMHAVFGLGLFLAARLVSGQLH